MPPVKLCCICAGPSRSTARETSATGSACQSASGFQHSARTSKGFEVKAGEFIQVVDIQGRECSDFQAFSRRALDKGLEREIDPTTTRSLMGSLYPAPGIYSKYFSIDHEPLVEIVQDTCGRHDTFGLACTARYYEDLGYPGHVNCSDNINKDMARYGIKPRGGWPAINFFFQYHSRRCERHRHGRSLVTAGRLCIAESADRSGLRFDRMSV